MSPEKILTDIIDIILPLKGDLSGKVYKHVRPSNSSSEDIVVTAVGTIIRKFVVYTTIHISVYCKDVLYKKGYYPNSKRLGEIQDYLYAMSEAVSKKDYKVDFSGREMETFSVSEVDIQQHQVTLVLPIQKLINS